MRVLILSLFVLLLAAGLTAQHYPGDYFSVTWGGWFLKSTPTGKVTSLLVNGNSHYQVEMDLNNQTVLVADSTARAIWKVDPNTLAITGTLVSSAALSSTVYGMVYDCNGDLFVAMAGQLGKVDPFGAMSLVGGASSLAQHMTIDRLTGDLIVGKGSTVYRLARDGSKAVTLGSGFSFRYGDLAQDILTGDVFVPSCCGWSSTGQSLHYMAGGSGAAAVFLAHSGLAGAYGPNMDRASAAQRRIVTGSHIYTSSYPNSGGMWYLDLATKKPQKFALFPHKTISDTTIIGSREIQTVKTAAGKYDIYFSVPADAGKSYQAAISLTGVRPGVPLPDGRRIPFMFDNFSLASINGWLSPLFLARIKGTLDNHGTALGKMSVVPVYNALKGARIWFILFTFDAKAPLGIATITDPALLVID